jgi:hypothetical protein
VTARLPIKTNFCQAEVPLWDGLSFFIDGNSKITASNGSYDHPKPNAFSLPAASVSGSPHCPGSTAACRSACYVHGLAKHAPEIYARYLQNADVLAYVLRSWRDALDAATILGDWITENAPGGFRWHVSGDVQSLEHAKWIADVCAMSRDVSFWIYTRTLVAGIIEALIEAPNLTVNISADRENYYDARTAALATGARLTYLAREGEWVPTLPAGSVIFPDYPLRGRDLPEPTEAPWWQTLTQEQRAQICPTDFFGQSEAHRCGPCRKCL